MVGTSDRAASSGDGTALSPFNVLITSLSGKFSCLREVRRGLQKHDPGGKVFGGDTNPDCPARGLVDSFWHMPPTAELSVEELVRYCHDNAIRVLVPTRDGELEYFALHGENLNRQGVAVMAPGIEAVRTCLDKLAFSSVLGQRGFPVIPASSDLAEVEGDNLVVKERFGAGGHGIALGLTRAGAAARAAEFHEPLFQPLIAGREVSIDLFVTRGGEVKGTIARSRDQVVDGESRVTTAIDEAALEALCADMARALDLRGHAVWQALIGADGGIHIIECNTRIGGASSLSLAMGLDSFYWFFVEAGGGDLAACPFRRNPVNLRQIRGPDGEDDVHDPGL